MPDDANVGHILWSSVMSSSFRSDVFLGAPRNKLLFVFPFTGSLLKCFCFWAAAGDCDRCVAVVGGDISGAQHISAWHALHEALRSLGIRSQEEWIKKSGSMSRVPEKRVQKSHERVFNAATCHLGFVMPAEVQPSRRCNQMPLTATHQRHVFLKTPPDKCPVNFDGAKLLDVFQQRFSVFRI